MQKLCNTIFFICFALFVFSTFTNANEVYESFWLNYESKECFVHISLTNCSDVDLLNTYNGYIKSVIYEMEESSLGEPIVLLNVDSVIQFDFDFPEITGNTVFVTAFHNTTERNKFYSSPSVISGFNSFVESSGRSIESLKDELGLSQYISKCNSVTYTGIPQFDPVKNAKIEEIVRDITKEELVDAAIHSLPSNPDSNAKIKAFQTMSEHSGFEDAPMFLVHTFSEGGSSDLWNYRVNVLQAVLPYGIFPLIDIHNEISNISKDQMNWKEITIVRWPSRKVFLSVMASENYAAGFVHRKQMASKISTFSRVCSEIFPKYNYSDSVRIEKHSSTVLEQDIGSMQCMWNHCHSNVIHYFSTSFRECVYKGEIEPYFPICVMTTLFYGDSWELVICSFSNCISDEILYSSIVAVMIIIITSFLLCFRLLTS